MPGPVCQFKALTHVPCPTCGSARGALCVLYGRPWAAWTYNPMVFTCLVAFVVAVGLRVCLARAVRVQLTRAERWIAWSAAAALFAANWTYVILCVG